jgi:hypothetical protein
MEWTRSNGCSGVQELQSAVIPPINGDVFSGFAPIQRNQAQEPADE